MLLIGAKAWHEVSARNAERTAVILMVVWSDEKCVSEAKIGKGKGKILVEIYRELFFEERNSPPHRMS